MPTYTYRCRDCRYEFEIEQRMSEPSLTDCPRCEEGHLGKVINSVGVVFKGNGFYVTDNRNGRNGHGPAGAAKTNQESKSESSETPTAKAKESDKKEKTTDSSN